MAETISFSEKNKGWTSFFSYNPGLMCRLNNRFFTIKNGQLYRHNSESVPRNNFYGIQSKSKVVTIFNDEAQHDKIFKTIVTESDKAWKVSVRTNLTNSTIDSNEFNNRESRWFGYIRRNEDSGDLNSSTQGIGSIVEVSGTEVSFNSVSETVSVGDKLIQDNNGELQEVGTIENIEDGVIYVTDVINAPESGLFCFGKKNGRINGSAIRGYFMEVTLEDSTESPNELFGVSTNVVKSYL